VLKSIRPFTSLEQVRKQVIRAQYDKGVVNAKPVKSYPQDLQDCQRKKGKELSQTSSIETFVALKLFVDNWRWAGVPFFLRTGKRMADSKVFISVCFKDLPQPAVFESHQNWVFLGIKPECLSIETTIKRPEVGAGILEAHTHQKILNAHLREIGDPLEDAYEELLLNVIRGDRSLFLHIDEVLASWQVVDPILKGWQEDSDIPLHKYHAGMWGPHESDSLFEEPPIAPPKRTWRNSLNR
jgi:glucose-6-phosphate 1-dehydrogenase